MQAFFVSGMLQRACNSWTLVPILCHGDAAEYAYVTQFGRPVTVSDGETDAGLHWKLPWPMQSAIRLDRRLQIFDLPTPELLTHDAAGRTIDRTLSVSAYVCWRIASVDG